MISTDDIAIRVYHLLNNSGVKGMISGSIAYFRTDYSKEDVIIVAHRMEGSSSVRHGRINVNIHVPDLSTKVNNATTYVPNFKRLNSIRKEVATILRKHYESSEGYSWTVGGMDPAIKEEGHNEHFMCVRLEITVRQRNV